VVFATDRPAGPVRRATTVVIFFTHAIDRSTADAWPRLQAVAALLLAATRPLALSPASRLITLPRERRAAPRTAHEEQR